ncbi:MAG: aminotransferase class IV [Gracilimonas sp.]|uniref:aminotransferase class IV n=1 Tax=Gracilimonas sp. TaxID=1974203 RepID=UPI0019BB9DB5|nr:aminotransferase class IV [Gracilimonas sp.]MBD3615935.1 aminotransferase class IV [Gracilimonas sp.]
MSESLFIVLSGELVKANEASVSPLDRGLMYGDGCFETMRSYAGKFLEWVEHFNRLAAGLNYLGIDPAFTSGELKAQVLKVLDENDLKDKECMVRIQCWRKGERGYKTSSHEMNWMIQASEIKPDALPLNLSLAETRCIPSEALQRKYKLSNGLNYIKAAQEAGKRLCDDSLMLTIDEKISETTSSNIFWIQSGNVFTPSEICDLLPGVTRNLVIDIIKSLGITVQQGVYETDHIKGAEAVFCTNSLIEIREVLSLDDILFEINHPLVMQIKEGFEQHKVQKLKA